MKMFEKAASKNSRSHEEKYQQSKTEWRKLHTDWYEKRISFEKYIAGYLNQLSPNSTKHDLDVSKYSDTEREQMMKHLTKLGYNPKLEREFNDMAPAYYTITFTAPGKNKDYEDFSDLVERDTFLPCKVQ